ncbi:MAG: DegV family protein [SAR202 cluster bacterium]|nr:DegV family protein [SAR202 cluster bacterium]
MEAKVPVAIVTDSGASLPETSDILLNTSILRVVPQQIVVDGQSFLDGQGITHRQFYRSLPDMKTMPTTSAPSPVSFAEAFRSATVEGMSVLCITVSPEFSSTYRAANLALGLVKAEQPGADIQIVDSETAAGGQGLIVLEAVRLATAGYSIDQISNVLKRLTPQVRLLAFLDTLRFLWKSGRVPVIAHWGTRLLQIKPLFEMHRSNVKVIARVRSRRRALTRMVDLSLRDVGSRKAHIAVLHGDDPVGADDIRTRFRMECNAPEIYVSEFSPVMGAHTGPGLLGVAYWVEDE